jgi:hypothetical protein
MSIRSLFATAWNLCCVISAAVFQRGRRRRIARIVIAMNLIIWPSPRFAAQGIGVFLSQVSQASAQLAVSAREVPVWIRSVFRKKRHQDTPSDRLSSVRGLDVSPAKLVAHVGQTMSFAGRPSDFAGRAVQGLRLSWTSSDPNKAAVSDLGLATFLGPGLAWITASAGAISARAPVLVLAEARQPQTDADWDAEQGRLSIDGSLSPSGGGFKEKLSSILDNLLPAAYAQSGGDDSGDLGFDGLWNNPANLIGNPVNRLTERTYRQCPARIQQLQSVDSAVEPAGSGRPVKPFARLQLAALVTQRKLDRFQRCKHVAIRGIHAWLRPHHHLRLGLKYQLLAG